MAATTISGRFTTITRGDAFFHVGALGRVWRGPLLQ